MADPRQDPRIKHGLIPILVAMRVKAERERMAAEAAKKAAETRAALLLPAQKASAEAVSVVPSRRAAIIEMA